MRSIAENYAEDAGGSIADVEIPISYAYGADDRNIYGDAPPIFAEAGQTMYQNPYGGVVMAAPPESMPIDTYALNDDGVFTAAPPESMPVDYVPGFGDGSDVVKQPPVQRFLRLPPSYAGPNKTIGLRGNLEPQTEAPLNINPNKNIGQGRKIVIRKAAQPPINTGVAGNATTPATVPAQTATPTTQAPEALLFGYPQTTVLIVGGLTVGGLALWLMSGNGK